MQRRKRRTLRSDDDARRQHNKRHKGVPPPNWLTKERDDETLEQPVDPGVIQKKIQACVIAHVCVKAVVNLVLDYTMTFRGDCVWKRQWPIGQVRLDGPDRVIFESHDVAAARSKGPSC